LNVYFPRLQRVHGISAVHELPGFQQGCSERAGTVMYPGGRGPGTEDNPHATHRNCDISIFHKRPIPFRPPAKTQLSEMASLAGHTFGSFYTMHSQKHTGRHSGHSAVRVSKQSLLVDQSFQLLPLVACYKTEHRIPFCQIIAF
jgi:hypothetical protein